jgi:hypothetical protein
MRSISSEKKYTSPLRLLSSSWVASSSTYATASPGTDFSTNITGFPGAAGTGTLQIMTFLKSDGTSACEVDNLQITGKKY